MSKGNAGTVIMPNNDCTSCYSLDVGRTIQLIAVLRSNQAHADIGVIVYM